MSRFAAAVSASRPGDLPVRARCIGGLALMTLLAVHAPSVVEGEAGSPASRPQPRFSAPGAGQAHGLLQPPPVGCGSLEFYGDTILTGLQFYPPTIPNSPHPKAHLALSGGTVFWSDASATPINKASFDARTFAPLAISMGEVESFVVNGQFIYWEDARDGDVLDGAGATQDRDRRIRARSFWRTGSNCSATLQAWSFPPGISSSTTRTVLRHSRSNASGSALEREGGAATAVASAGPAGGGNRDRIKRTIVGITEDDCEHLLGRGRPDSDTPASTLISIPKSRRL